MDRLIAVIRTGWTLFVGAMATLLIGSSVIVMAHLNPTSPRIESLARAWSRWWLVAGGVKLEIRGQERVDPKQSYVIVANHRSDFDIMACFIALPVPIRYLAKQELFKVPVLASAMRSIGIIEVDRDAHASIHEQINRQAKQLTEAGRSLMIYPEGTRTRDGSMGTFKKGAFTMAVSAGLPVLPVTIHGSRAAWPPLKLVRGGPITVVIDDPIETDGLGREDVEGLRERVRDLIVRRLDEIDAERATSQS